MNRKGLNIAFGVLFVILAAAIIYLLTVLSAQKKDAEEMRVTLEMQKDKLTTELQTLYQDYNQLKTDNDSMNVLLNREKQKITDLLAIKASNSKKIQVYEEQITGLRSILKSYIIQVDSLNQANLRLRAENQEVKNRFEEAKSINRDLENQNKDLTGKVEKAAVIKAVNVVAEPINDAGAVQKKIKTVDKIRVCFTLGENSVAKHGPRKIYMRIANPSQRVMVKSGTDTFTLDGATVPYSAMREVEYEGESLEVCIFYELGGETLTPGTYYIDLYLEGAQVGTTSFSIK
jgi:hypothetical protein